MEPEIKLTAESASAFHEGIGMVMARWSSLQLAVEHGWGGRDSHLIAEQLHSDVFTWFLNTPEANGRRVPPLHVRQVLNDDDDDTDEDDDGDRSMGRDDSSNMMVDKQGSTRPEPQAEDGWEKVGSRKNRGRRN